MHVENITSNAMSLDRNGQSMLIQVYEKEIERLNNIINELEKWIEDNLGNCRTNQNYTSNQIYNLKEDAYYRCLNRLRELKENNKDV